MMSRTHKENLGEHITLKYHADLLPKNEDEPAIRIFAHVSKNGIKIGAKSKHGEIIREIPWTKLDFRDSFKSINALEEEIRRIEEKLVSSAIKGNDEYYRNVIFHMHGTPASNTLRLLAREMDRNIIENVLRAHIDAGYLEEIAPRKYVIKKSMHAIPLFGANSAIFYVPKNVDIKGYPGHNKLIPVQDLTAEEFIERIEQRKQEQKSTAGRIRRFLRKLRK